MLDKVYKKLEPLAKGIEKNLRNKGFVVPTENSDGTITVGRYTIQKKRSGFYKISNILGETIVDHINLPQTAALLANNLALGRWVDDRLLTQDRQYGYNLFEEQQAKRIIENHKDWDKVDVMHTKLDIVSRKKISAKQSIMFSFEKLRNVR
jgi:hypothetical protein